MVIDETTIDVVVKREFDPTIELADNAMLKHRPDLFDEWDFEKNDELGLDVYKVSYGSDKRANWICKKCKSHYIRSIQKARTLAKCPYCSGNKINHTNSLATLKPDLALEWHPTKNGGLTPHDVTCGKGTRVHWLGKCGHEWESSILKRAGRGDGCPYCSIHPKVLKGFSDMWTTNPDLASQLADPEDGYKYTQHSNVKVEWVCLSCKTKIGKRVITSINREGVSCPLCSDGFSYGEKFIYTVLTEANIVFEREKVFSQWGKGKRYDFYLTELNWIVEVHGKQHYGDGFESYGNGAKSLIEEQENDSIKETLAKENGISEYLIINARESNFDFILNSLRKSKLSEILLLENLSMQEMERKICKSLVYEACMLWLGKVPIKEISRILKVSRYTVRKYLKSGKLAGFCDYDEVISRNLMSERGKNQ